MIWYDSEIYGMIRCDMVKFGVMWYDMKNGLICVVWSDMHDMCDMYEIHAYVTWYVLTEMHDMYDMYNIYRMEWYRTAWNGMEWNGMYM